MKKVLACALVAAMSATLLAGCGNSGSSASGSGSTGVTDVSLKVWVPQNQIDSGIIDEQQKAFAEAHPEWNITWNTAAVGEDTAYTEVSKDVAEAADVFFYASDQVTNLVGIGALARLGGETETMVKEGTAESVVNTVTVDGALYGIPFTHNTFFMYYDKSLLTEDDVKNLDTIVAKDTGDGVYNFNFDSAGGWKLGSWYYGAGLTVFGNEGNDLATGCDWNSETGIAVTNYLIDLLGNPKVGNGLVVEELAADHKIGAWFGGSWEYEKYYEALGDDLAMTTIPTYILNGEEVQLKGFYGSKAIGVNAQSDNLPAAIAFAAYLGSEEQQIARYEKSSQIPANIAASEIEAVQSDAMAAVIVDEANNCSVAQPSASLFGDRYWNYSDTIPTSIKTGDLTKDNVQQFMDELVKSMTAE